MTVADLIESKSDVSNNDEEHGICSEAEAIHALKPVKEFLPKSKRSREKQIQT